MEINIRPKFRWQVFHRYRLDPPDPREEYLDSPFGGFRIVPDSKHFDWKEPLEIDPKLFERFANLYQNPTKYKFLEFAQAYGTLEIPRQDEPYSNLGHWWMSAAEFDSWVSGSWEAENELAEALRSRIEQTGETVLLSTVADENGRTWRLTGPTKPPYNKEMYQHLISPERKLGLLIGNLIPLLDRDPKTGKMEFTIAPQSLLGAMALQLARHFGPINIKQCPNCSTRFKVGPGTGRRKNTKFCSNVCRYRFRDKRKKKT